MINEKPSLHNHPVKVSNRNRRGTEQALIIINAEVSDQGKLLSTSPVTERMVVALQKGINTYSPKVALDMTSVGSLWSKTGKKVDRTNQPLYCPLTIQLPEYFDFPAKRIYQACREISGRRRWVESNLGFKTSVGDSWLGHLWLPIILTKDQTLFGNIIGEGAIPNCYEQSLDFPSSKRKPLYKLATDLLDSLSAIPSVYLLQFSLYSNEIVFDRLWPFPAAPALASLSGSNIDLYSCHWLCLSEQAIPGVDEVTTMSIS